MRGRLQAWPGRRAKRYLQHFDAIWRLQGFLLSEADRAGVPIVDNEDVDEAVDEVEVEGSEDDLDAVEAWDAEDPAEELEAEADDEAELEVEEEVEDAEPAPKPEPVRRSGPEGPARVIRKPVSSPAASAAPGGQVRIQAEGYTQDGRRKSKKDKKGKKGKDDDDD